LGQTSNLVQTSGSCRTTPEIDDGCVVHKRAKSPLAVPKELNENLVGILLKYKLNGGTCMLYT